MSNTTISCIFPLVETVHPPYITLNETPCGLSCGHPRDFHVVFTREEENKLKIIIFIISLTALFFAPLYICVAISKRLKYQRSFSSLPFALQCPFFISSGYLLLALITMSPHVFGFASIICNDNDYTLTRDIFYNVPCSLTAIGVYLCIRLVIFYTCAHSIELALTLYYPNSMQLKRYFHICIWTCIGIGIIPISLTKSVVGDYYLGFCTTSLSSRSYLL